MKISDFSIGDTVHRIAPGGYDGRDQSWIGHPFSLEWLEKGIIFLKPLRPIHGCNLGIQSLPECHWGDGWDYYPTEAATRLGVIEEVTA